MPKELDWAWLYYKATVELKMSEDSFWNCTHKKLLALLEIHNEVNRKKYGLDDSEEEGFIDNIIL